jgi:hypothetical protein
MEDADAAAVQVAIRPSLQLQHLQLCVKWPAALLKQLPPNRLTNLEIVDSSSGYGAACEQLPAALKRFTGLRDLSITGQWYTADDSVATALGIASGLTRLRLQPALPASSLQQLPFQLVELSSPDCQPGDLVLHASALRQLQSLTLLYSTDMMMHHDILSHAPVWATIPVLRQLDFEFCNRQVFEEHGEELLQLCPVLAAGVAKCTQLTRLYGWFDYGCAPEADALQMLCGLRQLESLELCLCEEHEPFQSFEQLFTRDLTQLKSLSLSFGPLQQPALAQLCFQATQVTQLVLCSAGITAELPGREQQQHLQLAGGK